MIVETDMKKSTASTHKTSVDLTRRRLMTGAIGAGAAAGLGLVSMNAQAAPAVEPKPEPKATQYRETEHIRRYYRSAQF